MFTIICAIVFLCMVIATRTLFKYYRVLSTCRHLYTYRWLNKYLPSELLAGRLTARIQQEIEWLTYFWLPLCGVGLAFLAGMWVLVEYVPEAPFSATPVVLVCSGIFARALTLKVQWVIDIMFQFQKAAQQAAVDELEDMKKRFSEYAEQLDLTLEQLQQEHQKIIEEIQQVGEMKVHPPKE